MLFSSRGSLSRIERVFLHVIAWTIVLVPLMIVGAAWKPWPFLSLLIPTAMLAGATVAPSFVVVLGLALLQGPIYGIATGLPSTGRTRRRVIAWLVVLHASAAGASIVLGLPPSRTITDVTIAQTVSLKGRGDDAVTAVVVRVTGSINGSATLRFMDGSQTMVDGAVDRSWRFDNYSRQVSIEYLPHGVTDGKLTFRAEFR